MKTIEITDIESTDFRSIELKVGDILCTNGKKEFVTETHYEEKKLIRFRSIRRDDGRIAESGYFVDKETGKLERLFSGIYFNKENPPFHASERYSELNKFLEEQEK